MAVVGSISRFARGSSFVSTLLAVLMLLVAAPVPALDFTPNGTQPGLAAALEEPDACSSCHRGFNAQNQTFMPHSTWGGSMMANAARDPLFWAALDVANKDYPGAGDYCLRCHTPPGWLNGRVVKAAGGGSTGAGGASGCQLTGNHAANDYKGNDYSGVTCHFCHRMMPTGPLGQSGFIGNGNTWIDDATQCTTPNNDVFGGPCRRGPYTYTDGTLDPPHGWVYSDYHTKSAQCGSCHDVSTPDTDAGPLKTLVLENGTTTTRPFPIERTYSEWNRSVFSDLIFRDGLGNAQSTVPALAKAQHCQDCHMKSSQNSAAKACNQNPNGSRAGNLPMHEFAGANAWIPKIIKSLYGGPTGIDREADFDRTVSAAVAMLQSAALVETSITSYTAPTAGSAGSIGVRVKVTNLSGHKLPTGYSEGRRMWLNVRVLNASSALVAESGAYDALTGVLTLDPQVKIYETLQGIWDPSPPGVCRTTAAGVEQFHFVLNNCVAKDNRIPPLGFRPATTADPNGDEVRPVNYAYPATSPGSGTLVNYDTTDYTFTLPAGTPRPIQVNAKLEFQIASRAYVEFLRDFAAASPAVPAENTLCAGGPDRPFTVGPQSQSRGQFMYDLWSNPTYGKSPPETAGNLSGATTPN